MNMPERIKRLKELARIIAQRPDGWQGELSMRVPAEPDRDADLVITWAAQTLETIERDYISRAELREYCEKWIAVYQQRALYSKTTERKKAMNACVACYQTMIAQHCSQEGD